LRAVQKSAVRRRRCGGFYGRFFILVSDLIGGILNAYRHELD
jgi:hypothetical protein